MQCIDQYQPEKLTFLHRLFVNQHSTKEHKENKKIKILTIFLDKTSICKEACKNLLHLYRGHKTKGDFSMRAIQ